MTSTLLISQSLCDDENENFRVLHFTKTTGFDHNTRVQSNQMFVDIGLDKGFTVTNTNDANYFNELDTLEKFAVIIFSNTSGNSLFNDPQKANMESYINQGGSFIGIHAATDTYRTGWPFYNMLVGGIVQTNPNHTSNNHVNFMDHQNNHEVLDGLPDPWEKEEEYYYWDLNGGMVDEENVGVLLTVRRTGSNSYDRERPTTWLRSFESGARSFYTSLGHKRVNFETTGNEFRQLLTNAVCWTAYDKNAVSASAIGPSAKILDSHLFIENGDKGLLMKSPNGGCYKLSIDNSGQLKSIPVACPQ